MMRQSGACAYLRQLADGRLVQRQGIDLLDEVPQPERNQCKL